MKEVRFDDVPSPPSHVYGIVRGNRALLCRD